MFLFELVVFVAALRSFEARHKCKGNEPYFDQNDLFDADCINIDAVKDGYFYVGNKNKTIDNRECAPWNRVWQYLKLKGSINLPKIHERQSHHSCRQMADYDAHPGVFAFSFDGSEIPWCYTYQQDKTTLEPAPCFAVCTRICVQDDPEVIHPVIVIDPPTPNYNEELLDNLLSYFPDYIWGDEDEVQLYYDELQSKIVHSELYYKARTGTFFSVLTIFLFICGYYAITIFLKRRAKKSRDKKDAMQGIINAQTPAVTEKKEEMSASDTTK